MTAEERKKLLRCKYYDCFASRCDSCTILTEAIKAPCPFFKTIYKAVCDRSDALKRINSLTIDERKYILEKYYRDYHTETKDKKDWLKGVKKDD